MKLTSPSFEHNQPIPSTFTCEGLDHNPALQIHDVPKNAISLVLIVEDPDVPLNLRADGMWDHWVVFNIPPNTTNIKENYQPEGIIGKNTSNKATYQGPCPPDRKHRYFFKLYALDTMLPLKEGASKKEVLDAMEGHIIADAVLIGTYEKHH